MTSAQNGAGIESLFRKIGIKLVNQIESDKEIKEKYDFDRKSFSIKKSNLKKKKKKC